MTRRSIETALAAGLLLLLFPLLVPSGIGIYRCVHDGGLQVQGARCGGCEAQAAAGPGRPAAVPPDACCAPETPAGHGEAAGASPTRCDCCIQLACFDQGPATKIETSGQRPQLACAITERPSVSLAIAPDRTALPRRVSSGCLSPPGPPLSPPLLI